MGKYLLGASVCARVGRQEGYLGFKNRFLNKPLVPYLSLRYNATKPSFPIKKSETIAPTAAMFAGGSAGFLGSLCGVGGGIVMIPAMKHFTSLKIHKITATSLMAVTVSSFFGAFAYIDSGIADTKAAASIAVASIFTSVLGVKAAKKISGRGLSVMLALCMLSSIPLILLKEKTENPDLSESGGFNRLILQINSLVRQPNAEFAPDVVDYLKTHIHYPIIGAATGFLSGLLGIGGGILMTTMLSSLGFLGLGEMTQHTAVATAIVAMFPAGLSATTANFRQGNLHVGTGILLSISSSVAMYATARFIAPELDELYMRYLVCAVLGLSAVRMLL